MVKERFFALILIAALSLSGCEGGLDFSGTEKEDVGVNINMTIVMSNTHSSAAYMMLDNELQNSSTLVSPNGSRTTTEAINVSSDSRYEHIYDLVIKVKWGEEGNGTETTHHVDYKKYELDFEKLDEAPTLNLRINATFNGTKISVTETKI
ncbi:MAG: hypothetical protein RBS73_06125 [Prolixibacteraceae bacterium]|jgi:hypothetical protein|nr:hypothetical protein [Prolixibacteraceae bacterium]